MDRFGSHVYILVVTQFRSRDDSFGRLQLASPALQEHYIQHSMLMRINSIRFLRNGTFNIVSTIKTIERFG